MKKTLFVALLFVPAYLALAFCFFETYRSLQFDSFFLFTSDYFFSKFAQPPALTAWATSLLFQLFRWPWVAALLQALIACLAVVCLNIVLKNGLKRWLSLIPSLLLFLFWPFSLNLQLQVLFMSLLLLSYSKLPRWWAQLIWAIILIPLGFLLLSMPLLAVLFLLFAVIEWFLHKGRTHALVVALLGACTFFLPPIYSQRVAFIPFQMRYTYVPEGSPIALWDDVLVDQEVYLQVLRAAEEERWSDLRSIIRGKGVGNKRLMQNYLLLAEAAQGTLPDNLFSYNINNPEDFFYRHERNPYTCQFNRLFYRNLGLYDECFHQAQEYYLLCLDACCFGSLTQMVDYSIREGEYAVAEKYLKILSRAPFYSRFVEEQRNRIAKQKAEVTIERPLRDDNFVGGYPFCSEMVRLVQHTDANQPLAQDYLLCGLLLQKNLPHFDIVLREIDYHRARNLPVPYAQALRLFQTRGEVSDEDCVNGSYYYFFRYIDIPDPNQQMTQSAGH